MTDDMFSFIDPVVESMEENLFQIIQQVDVLLDEMERSGKLPKVSRALTEETYKEMWLLKYDYQMGKLGFLELLEKYEELLNIAPDFASTEQ